MQRLTGKFALITGGSSGIGLATAKLFAAEGARVAITGRDASSLSSASRAIGNDTLTVQSDAGDLKQIDALFASIDKQFGGLDILFANAGVSMHRSLESATEEDFDRVFATNVKGVFFTVQKALPLLRDGASIILNASIAARMGRPGLSLYAASKAAVRAFARNFSAELAPRGIRVNVVSPGPIDTPIWGRGGNPDAADAFRRHILAGVPLKRMGSAEEIAQAVLFLASDDSRYLLGSEMVIDGGTSELPGGA